MCFAARVWSRPRAETPEMSTLALSAAASARAHAQHAAAMSRAHASRAASIAPTMCHARSVSAVLASHRRLGDAAARSRVASWASSHRRASATSASASPADGASEPDDGSLADAEDVFEDAVEDDSYEAFVASWRASLPTMEPNERAEAHRASCAEGRRKANEKRRKRAVRSRTRTFFSLSFAFHMKALSVCLPRGRRRLVAASAPLPPRALFPRDSSILAPARLFGSVGNSP